MKKKRHNLQKERISEKMKQKLVTKKSRKVKDNEFVSAPKVIKDYREKQKSYINFKRKLRNRTLVDSYDPTKENTPVIIIRISGNWDRIANDIKTLLLKLKMKRLYSALILKYDKQTFKLINLIEAYITWGYINKTSISDLIYKRATYYGNDKHLVPLDNNIVENNLGQLNLVCIEDIVHELATCGKRFKEVVNFLGFFLLSPTDEVKKKIHLKVEKGGAQGFRGDKINELLKKMI